MSKVTPDPPKTDKTTNPNADYVHLSPADIRAIPRKPCTQFIVNPEVHIQEVLGFASEALASACVMTMNHADRETGAGRNVLLGIHLAISAAEISVNRALDYLDPIE